MPPLTTGKIPVMPVDSGRPVAFVRTPDTGVPKAGVTKVGDVAKTNAPDPVSSDTAVRRLAEDGVAKKVATPVPKPDTPVEIGKPVALVNVADDGVPKAGVTKAGLVARTTAPEPVEVVLPVPPEVTGRAVPSAKLVK